MGQVQPGQQGAVDEAHQSARQDGDDHQQDTVGQPGVFQRAHEAGAEDGVGAHGQVDARGDQAEQHAHGQEGVEGRLLENAHDVAVAVEVLIRDGKERAHYHQRQDRTELYARAAFFLSHLNYLPKPLS